MKINNFLLKSKPKHITPIGVVPITASKNKNYYHLLGVVGYVYRV